MIYLKMAERGRFLSGVHGLLCIMTHMNTQHCKCLQGFTGALQGFLRTGVLKLKGLHVAGVPCSSLQGFPVCITGKPL